MKHPSISPEIELDIELDDALEDFLHDYRHGYDNSREQGLNLDYCTFDTRVAFLDFVREYAQKKYQEGELKGKLLAASHLHRNQGDGTRREYDNDTDEYICMEYLPSLQSHLKEREGNETS